MQRFRKTVIAVATLLLTTSLSMPLHAAESSIKVVFEDSVYGGLVGTLVGAATLAFTKHPSDHLENIGYGAAVGVIAGAGVGVATNINRAMVEYEKGKLKLAVPKVLPDFQETAKGQIVLAVKADILHGTF